MAKNTKKRRKKRVDNEAASADKPKLISKTAIVLLLALVAVTVVALTVYRFFMNGPHFRTVLIVYMVLGAVSALGYVIYNRGFSRRGVTREMLPDDWSDEKKDAFLADGVRRMKRSRWLLIVVFAIFLTLAVDMIELYVLPTFQGIFGIE